jgi:drug/metabolite transporter (DMT)-like permease
LFPSILAYFCFNRSVAQLGANRAGLSLQLIPLFGAGLAIALLGETFGAYHAVGTALILGGLVLAHTARKKRPA